MNKIKDENYFQVSGWMINRLELKGNELIIFAIIYGFTQTEGQWFTGTRKYLAKFAGCAIGTVDNCLSSLVQKGLLEKQENMTSGVKFCYYRANYAPAPKIVAPPPQKLGYPAPKIGGIDNNNIINSDKSIILSADKSSESISPKRPQAVTFGYDTDAKIHGITPEQIAYWKDQFPAVDVEQEIRNAEAWLDGNRKQRKHDIKRFLSNWLMRTQERSRKSPGGNPGTFQQPRKLTVNDPDYWKTRATHPGDEDAGKEFTNGF